MSLSTVDHITENTSSPVNPMDEKEFSNESSTVTNHIAENTSSPINLMDKKEWPEGVELNLCMKHNELEIASTTPEQLRTQSFPQSDGASDKIKHIDYKHSTAEKNPEDEDFPKSQFAMHPDENILNTYGHTDEHISKINSSILAEESIPQTKVLLMTQKVMQVQTGN